MIDRMVSFSLGACGRGTLDKETQAGARLARGLRTNDQVGAGRRSTRSRPSPQAPSFLPSERGLGNAWLVQYGEELRGSQQGAPFQTRTSESCPPSPSHLISAP